MTETLTRSREWLLLNAVEAWLHHYEGAGTPTVAQYKELQQEFHDAYMQTLHKDAGEPSESPAELTPKATTSTRKRTRNASHSSAS
jgi:hypothetical protein